MSLPWAVFESQLEPLSASAKHKEADLSLDLETPYGGIIGLTPIELERDLTALQFSPPSFIETGRDYGIS